MRIKILIVFLVLFVAVVAVMISTNYESFTNIRIVNNESEGLLLIPDEASPAPANESAGGVVKVPTEFNLDVPFTVQAPYADWDLPYQEACEEAAMIMVDAFYKKRKLTKKSSDQEILDLVEWETKNLGDYKDSDAQEVAKILKEYFGYENVRVIYDPIIKDIKKEVAQGRPVILLAAGRLLGNRYFHQPGPLYHALVVRGWKKNGDIITNDPGTKRGEEYLYKPEVLINAVHDWNEGDVENGRKVMIVVIPN